MPSVNNISIEDALKASKNKNERINLSRFARIMGITRGQARTLQRNGFKPGCGHKGRPARILDGFEETIREEYLMRGITNSAVIYRDISSRGYSGSRTTVKEFIRKNSSIIPAKRKAEGPLERAKRYDTGPGEMFQMDWGFSSAVNDAGEKWNFACFVMVCHHCRTCYVEFFPTARQENLFIGMIHSFMAMGVPEFVYTDNMRSVVTRRDQDGNPVWNTAYDCFQRAVGFRTVCTRIASPWQKGCVERLVGYVKSNFLSGRRFSNISELNEACIRWCDEANHRKMADGHVPIQTHVRERLGTIDISSETIKTYLFPLRRITYDGFISYDNRLFGVPYSLRGKEVRASREGSYLVIMHPVTWEVVYRHVVDWSRRPKPALGQWDAVPCEKPTAPVSVSFELGSDSDYDDERFRRFSMMVDCAADASGEDCNDH